MTQDSQALKVALAAAQQLPPKLQKQLAERLMRATTPDKNTVVVSLQRLSPHKQVRLTKLMDKNNEGRLSQAEQLELKRLGTEVDQMLWANSQALARALRPELFDKRGRPMKHRFRQALDESSFRRAAPRQENGRG
ncbi:MAG TPA: hypothetical protein VGX03_00900 [Candidatus Binatia bacterium]|jgi:hypothetical protein|nr:hypothetical protein [Candidatus Binatia bacterium]